MRSGALRYRCGGVAAQFSRSIAILCSPRGRQFVYLCRPGRYIKEAPEGVAVPNRRAKRGEENET